MLWYALSGLSTITHNEIRDLTASLLTEVSYYVAIEPSLQPVTTETFSIDLQRPLMMLVWILRPEASEVGARMHIMTFGCFSQMPPVITPLALNLLINVTRLPRSVNMVTELGLLNKVFYPIGFFFN